MEEKRVITFNAELENNIRALVECCPTDYLVRGILQTLYANGEPVTSANEEKYELKLCGSCNTMKNIEKPFSVCQRCVDGMSNKELLNKQWHDGYQQFVHSVQKIPECHCEHCESHKDMIKLSKLRVNKSGRKF